MIFDAVDNIPDEEGMAGAFQYMSNSVPLQNHSWGNSDFEPLIPGTIEILAEGVADRPGLTTITKMNPKVIQWPV